MSLSKIVVRAAGLAEARGIGERLSLATPEPLAVTEFETPATADWRVEAYFDVAPDLASIAELVGVGQSSVCLETVPDLNWVAVSQAALPPVHAGRFVVHGSHDRAAVGYRLGAIEIDAGEAFGTAHHATTYGCLLALDKLARTGTSRGVPFRRVLDLGCGSGVLAIAAARALPRAHIVASDIDPLATAVARGNVARNRVRARVRLVTAKGAANSTLRAGAPYDLLLANILAGPLVRLAPDLVPLMAWGGRAVLSGILADQASEVVAAWRTAGAKLIEGRTLAGWTTLVLRRG